MITKQDLQWWLDLEPLLDWQFATTYAAGAPHEYVTAPRTLGLEPKDYVRAAHVIHTFGSPMKFYSSTRVYLETPMGFKHWTMDRDLRKTGLVNRGRVEHVYGAQNAPCTASGIDSSYDPYASSWDLVHGMTEVERQETAHLVRAVFGERLGRTLDVGCGTGVPLDLGLVEPNRYVGIDPSRAMLNMLVAKQPHLAGLQAMRFSTAIANHVLAGTIFDTVFALGGSASYLSPEELRLLRSRAKREVLLMHYAEGEHPITGDLDAVLAADSYTAVSAMASQQCRIGRFIASVIS